jgi:hypothetical protein
LASRLYRDLRSAGAAPWIDTEDLLAGQNWKYEISSAIQRCTHFLALISAHSVNKQGFVQKELRHAIERLEMFPRGDVFVVPVRLDDSQPRDEALKDLHWLDLFPDYDEGLRKLLKSLRLDETSREVVEYDSYGPAAFRQTEHATAVGIAVRDDDGFLTEKSLVEMVLARVQGRQSLRSDPILLFENSHQRTWLVVTDRVVACVLDDTDKPAAYDPLRWQCRHRFALPIETGPYKKTVGLIHFGSEHRDWLYSYRIHPDPVQLKDRIEAMLLK